jgi:hypothetical protein
LNVTMCGEAQLLGTRTCSTSSLSESCDFTTGQIVIHWLYDQKIQNC